MLPSTVRRSFVRPQAFASRYALATRQYQITSRRLARKDDQDKDSINVESNEYSKSGGDSASAQATDDAAFNPQKTSPEEEHESARQEAGGESNNPLSVSPANPEISKPRGAQEGGAQGSPEETGSGSGRERTSGGGSAQKSGGGSSG